MLSHPLESHKLSSSEKRKGKVIYANEKEVRTDDAFSYVLFIFRLLCIYIYIFVIFLDGEGYLITPHFTRIYVFDFVRKLGIGKLFVPFFVCKVNHVNEYD